MQQATEARNAVGEVVQTWATVKTIWASVDPIRGDERLLMMQVKPTVDTKITIRANALPAVSPKHRIVYGDRIFDIDSVIDMQSRGIMRELYCKEHG